MRTFGIFLLTIGSCAVATASIGIPVPEVDAGTGVSAIALLGGALLVLRTRRRR